LPTRKRTAKEHLTALYERMMDLGWLHTHVTLEEFQNEFILQAVEPNDEKEKEKLDPLELFAAYHGAKFTDEAESTFAREEDRKNAIPRAARHAEILAKHPVDYWWRPNCPACRNEGKRHAPDCPAASVPGGNTPDPKKNPGGVRAA
jgi:hypothetical protein